MLYNYLVLSRYTREEWWIFLCRKNRYGFIITTINREVKAFLIIFPKLYHDVIRYHKIKERHYNETRFFIKFIKFYWYSKSIASKTYQKKQIPSKMKGNIQNLEDTITDKAISEILLDIRHEPPHDMMPFLS